MKRDPAIRAALLAVVLPPLTALAQGVDPWSGGVGQGRFPGGGQAFVQPFDSGTVPSSDSWGYPGGSYAGGYPGESSSVQPWQDTSPYAPDHFSGAVPSAGYYDSASRNFGAGPYPAFKDRPDGRRQEDKRGSTAIVTWTAWHDSDH